MNVTSYSHYCDQDSEQMTGNPDSRPQDYRAHAVMDQALVDLSNNFRRASFLKGLLQKVECHGGHRGYTGFDRRCIEWREER